jgi:hypothetical protein
MDVRVGMKDVHFDVHLKIDSVIIIKQTWGIAS